MNTSNGLMTIREPGSWEEIQQQAQDMVEQAKYAGTVPAAIRSDNGNPEDWFVSWVRKAASCGWDYCREEELEERPWFTPNQIARLLKLWNDGYSEDSAIETVEREYTIPGELGDPELTR